MMSSLIEAKNYMDSWTYYLYGRVRGSVQYYIYNGSFEASCILPNLYLGNLSSSYHRNDLKKIGVTHILTAVTGIVPAYPTDFEYKTVDLCDTITTNIQKYFNLCNQFIDYAITNQGVVFIHCICGVSRSATIVIAYLMYKYQYSREVAIKYVQNCRQCVNPNHYFLHQLALYEKYLKIGNNTSETNSNGEFSSNATHNELLCNSIQSNN